MFAWKLSGTQSCMYTFARVLCVGIPRNVLTVSVFPLMWAVVPYAFRSNYPGLRWFGVLARTFMYLCLCVWLHVYTHHRLSFLLHHTAHLMKGPLTKSSAMCVSVCAFHQPSCYNTLLASNYDGPVCHAYCRHDGETWPPLPPLSQCLFHMFIFTVDTHPSFLPSFLLLLSCIVCV